MRSLLQKWFFKKIEFFGYWYERFSIRPCFERGECLELRNLLFHSTLFIYCLLVGSYPKRRAFSWLHHHHSAPVAGDKQTCQTECSHDRRSLAHWKGTLFFGNYNITMSAEPFFCLLDFSVLCMNRVRSLLSIRGMLPGYIFEPMQTYSRVLATTGSVMIIDLSIGECSHSEKPVWREKTRLVRKFGLRRPQRQLDAIQTEPPFLLLTQDQEDKRRLISQGFVIYSWYFTFHQGKL